MAQTNSISGTQGLFAPHHEIAKQTFVSVEHPCLIQNIDNGIVTIGGDQKIQTLLASEASHRSLDLRFRPNEQLRKPIQSYGVETANVILQVTVPKRTGRKRKRGSDEPFAFHDNENVAARSAHLKPESQLRALQDNASTSSIVPIGMAEETHRFRGLPDFQWSTATSSLVKTLKESVLSTKYDDLRKFKLSLSKGVQPFMDMIPPPALAQNTMPFNYAYRQNPNVKITVDPAGRSNVVNISAPPKILTQTVPFDCDPSEIPTGPPPNGPPEETLDASFRSAIAKTRQYLQKRPITTRRVLLNELGREIEYDLKYAIQYCGYVWRSGPWRDALVAFGVDPRSDPKYRIYQTLVFKITFRGDNRDTTKWNRSIRATVGWGENQNRTTHVFDGFDIFPDGKVWQVCDIVDPQLRSILDQDGPNDTCDLNECGWYLNGAWAKMRVIMRDKISLIVDGVTPADSTYDTLMAIPNKLDATNVHLATFTRKEHGEKAMLMGADIRALAHVSGDTTHRGKVPRTIGVAGSKTMPAQGKDMEHGEADEVDVHGTVVQEEDAEDDQDELFAS